MDTSVDQLFKEQPATIPEHNTLGRKIYNNCGRYTNKDKLFIKQRQKDESKKRQRFIRTNRYTNTEKKRTDRRTDTSNVISRFLNLSNVVILLFSGVAPLNQCTLGTYRKNTSIH